MRKSLLSAVALAACMLPGVAIAQNNTIKIGILSSVGRRLRDRRPGWDP